MGQDVKSFDGSTSDGLSVYVHTAVGFQETSEVEISKRKKYSHDYQD
jgi:hypothetical protein